MPFVKLDTGIIDSSLWSEPAQTCKCWITLMAMANADGFVNATAPGIARRANLALTDTEKALEMFEAPDPHSRSLNDEGKRIRRVDGGYQIINYGKYRERDYTAAERMRRKRERDRVTRNGCNKTVTLRKQKQSTEADKKREGAKESRQTSTEDWLKSLQSDQTYTGINVRQEYGKMLNWCKVHGKQPTQRRFINWLNHADKPLTGTYSAPKQRAPVYPKLPERREPTQAEIATARAIAKRETDALRRHLNGGENMSDRDTKPTQPDPNPNPTPPPRN